MAIHNASKDLLYENGKILLKSPFRLPGNMIE